jgi:N-acetylneuraminic acid mutarotase
MNSQRSSAAATVCAGCIYVCGGYDGITRNETVERYNPAADQWDTIASMSCLRGGTSVVALER